MKKRFVLPSVFGVATKKMETPYLQGVTWERQGVMGASYSWGDPDWTPEENFSLLKCPLAGTNKRFLINTIKNTLPSQKEQDQEREQKEDSKEPEPNKSRKEEKPKKRRIHPYTPSFQSRRRVSYSPPRHRNRNQHTKDKHEKRSSKR
ncbi:protein POLR1D isoform X2 [Apus apus]|uniref:protein POLR1D isoform X2 n=1 Tax=Apus apus TaxID=8895 RepID=UPI0021F8D90C|nr:protein POLR1D isoform X2 [Apus apus]